MPILKSRRTGAAGGSEQITLEVPDLETIKARCSHCNLSRPMEDWSGISGGPIVRCPDCQMSYTRSQVMAAALEAQARTIIKSVLKSASERSDTLPEDERQTMGEAIDMVAEHYQLELASSG